MNLDCFDWLRSYYFEWFYFYFANIVNYARMCCVGFWVHEPTFRMAHLKNTLLL
jgi:hypothetical protein